MSHLMGACMDLLDDIEAFLEANEISATALGDRALGDRHFVRQLRQGRRVWPETEEKVRAFMAKVISTSVHVDVDAGNDQLQATGKTCETSGSRAGARA